MIQKYTYESETKGVSLLILGAVHGNETAGTIALTRFIQEMNEQKYVLKQGRLTLVPVCNPKAQEKDVRSIDENLNRVMTHHADPVTYEQQLANEIYPLIKTHQVLLDLHSTHCKGDVPFAFCDYPNELSLKLIDSLDVQYVLEGWPQIYANQSDIQDFSTEYAAHAEHNAGTTLECGYHKEPQAAQIAYNAIISTLKTFGMIAGDVPQPIEKQHILLTAFILKTKSGSLLKPYKHLDKIVAGEALARYDDGEILYAPEDGYILLPNHAAAVNTEWYYLGKEKSK